MRNALLISVMLALFATPLYAQPPASAQLQQSLTQQAQSDVNSLAQTIDGLKIKLEEANKKIELMQSSLETFKEKQFESSATHFAQLVVIGIGSFAIALALAAFLGNMWVKDRVTALHESELATTKAKLSKMVDAASADVGANIFTIIGGHCIDLYKNFDEPQLGGRHYNLYKSYVSMAVRVAANAYVYASKLEEMLESQPNEALTPLEKTRYRGIYEVALNNYVFYSAQRRSSTDLELLKTLLPKLTRVVNDRKIKGDEKWIDFQDTVIWAKLHIEGNAISRRNEVIELFSYSKANAEWCAAVKERYGLHNRTCLHEAEMVHL
jgi:hypothetical protein